MSARDHLLDLLANEEWRDTFAAACRSGASVLDSHAEEFAAALSDRSLIHRPEDVSDALFDLAAELLPETNAGAWDCEWAHHVVLRAVAYVREFHVEDSTLPDAGGEGIERAAKTGSRIVFRRAVRFWARNAVRASEATGKNAA